MAGCGALGTDVRQRRMPTIPGAKSHPHLKHIMDDGEESQPPVASVVTYGMLEGLGLSKFIVDGQMWHTIPNVNSDELCS